MKNSENTYISKYIGALPLRDGSTFFRVWAPFAETVSVEIENGADKHIASLDRSEKNYFEGFAAKTGGNDLYRYILDGRYAVPDPASRSQPHGVHGHSMIVDHAAFKWSDREWSGIPFNEYIIYELHAGAFTREGTFEAVTDFLGYFRELGINAIELMPVAQFPGGRNWGYDGTFPFAPQNTYGGPSGLKTLVDACHRQNISVILDVVYNHLGPEGNYLGRFGPYFTDRYHTPWGDAINFDGPLSDEVRRYFIESALSWITDYHIDALRIDAIHGIFDFSARTFLEDLVIAVKERGRETGRTAYLIAESDLNDIRVVTPLQKGGIGLDAQWNDDFHHALHTMLTGERNGYYRDFGTIHDMAKAFHEGYVYTGQYSLHRQRKHGSQSKNRPSTQFVIFSQNHDQVGNRALGDRLSTLLPIERLRMAAFAVILSPYIPLIFMGEEYGETAPFLYFVSHSDEALIEAVRTGRAEEFASFDWGEDVPDPQSEEAFTRSKISQEMRFRIPHDPLHGFYKYLIALRHSLRPWEMTKKRPAARPMRAAGTLFVLIPLTNGDIACLFNFNDQAVSVHPFLTPGSWVKLVDTASHTWDGTGETAPANIELQSPSSGTLPPVMLGPFNAVAYRKEV